VRRGQLTFRLDIKHRHTCYERLHDEHLANLCYLVRLLRYSERNILTDPYLNLVVGE